MRLPVLAWWGSKSRLDGSWGFLDPGLRQFFELVGSWTCLLLQMKQAATTFLIFIESSRTGPSGRSSFFTDEAQHDSPFHSTECYWPCRKYGKQYTPRRYAFPTWNCSVASELTATSIGEIEALI
ncbi:uncharacterized protein CLUP02_04643 [Colletotrichum lupini]|uniref:Uncharacterized protein n=1 Tax=Colletotrichum lupini TaxID=145971 RepID=A0A9Q8WDB0_9PEZI|nr:uncharacterized protein CLUP02_04643 [Colletotrichum lupini]UQC79164.1 hypothetical protein CLUP02_04643 [Colletotrichum lupini]